MPPMRPCHALLALAILLPAASQASERDVASRPVAVTIYPALAEVTRALEVTLEAGDHRLVVHGLPDGIDPATLRVEGEATDGLTVVSLDLRRAPLGEVVAPRDPVTQRLAALEVEEAVARSRLAAAEGKRTMIRRFAESGPGGLGTSGAALPVAQWAEAWAAVGTALTAAEEGVRQAEAALAALTRERAALERRRPQPAARAAAGAAVLAVRAEKPLRAALRLSYQVGGASWTPSYVAHLATGDARLPPQLTLTRRAIIRQQTGEDWSGVALTLSTLQPGRGTAAPRPSEWRVSLDPPVRPMAAMAPAARQADSEGPADRAMTAPVAMAGAALTGSNFAAAYRVPGEQSVPADGAPRTVTLGEDRLPVEMVARTVPALQARAYLEARFAVPSESSLLPGMVQVMRDGALAGQGRLEAAAPGDRVTLGFGVDDRITVKRVPLAREERERGWLDGQRGESRSFRITVRNGHGRPIRVVVMEPTPVSEHAAVVVELAPGTTPPTERAADNRRGLLAWSHEHKPGEEREITVGWRVRWPGDRMIEVGEPRP